MASTIASPQGRFAAAPRNWIAGHPVLSGFVAFTGLAALSRPATFRMPLAEDAGGYMYIGDVLLHGGTSYVDVADNKLPANHLLFALIRFVSDTSSVRVRLVLLLAAGLAATALALYVARFAGRAIGFLAGAVFAVLGSAAAVEGTDPNTEQFGVLPMVAGLWLATRGSRAASLAAGAAAAIASLINPGFVFVIPFVAFELWRAESPQARPRLERFVTALIGGLCVAAPIALWLGAAGALDDMVTQVSGYAREAANGHVPAGLSPKVVRHHVTLRYLLDVPMGAVWVGGLTGCAVAAANPRLRRVALVLAAWILVMWGRVKLSSFEYDHYYYPAVPGLAGGLAVGIGALWGDGWRRRVGLACLVLAVPVWSQVVGPQWKALAVPPWDRWGTGSPYAAAYGVAAAIDRATPPGARIMVAGHAGEVYWLADRRAPTRLWNYFRATEHAKYRREREAALRKSPPAAIAVLPTDVVDPDLQRLMAVRRYRLIYGSGGARVWVREGT